MLSRGLPDRIAQAVRGVLRPPASKTSPREPPADLLIASSSASVVNVGCSVLDYFPVPLEESLDHPPALPMISSAFPHEAVDSVLSKRMFDLREVPVAFIDCETAGSGSVSPIFLLGAVWLESQQWSTRQWLARDYSEECEMLSLFVEWLGSFAVVVTYNGARFDWPMLRHRCSFHRVTRPNLQHVDLLPLVRQCWRELLPDCRLTTVARVICGLDRVSDIPSAEIPARYHDYVRDPRACSLQSVLEHNRCDVWALAQCFIRLRAALRVLASSSTSPCE